MSDKRDEQAQQETDAEVSANTVQKDSQDVPVHEGDVISEESATADDSDAQQRIYELESALSEAEAKIKDQQEGVLRARADMENARRRADAEVEKARKFALERFAGELLPVVDNLERAIEAGDRSNEAVKPLLEGVEMTQKSFISTIDKFGVKPIDPQGEAFNPELHQAMSMQESADHEPNSVMMVMQKGYELNGRLLRPAMVMVARAPDSGVDTKA